LAEVALSCLVAASQGVLEVVRGFAKVGLVALWSEVIDAFALAGTSQGDLPGDPAVLTRLSEAARVPGMPWRKYPELWVAEVGGRGVHVGQKGGCCLAYLCEQVPDSALDEDLQAWRERFPSDPQGRNYCSSCSLLQRSECQDRQLYFVDT
jgi:hypothetical protein